MHRSSREPALRQPEHCGSEPLRPPHRLLLLAQFCPHRRLQRPRPILRHVRPLWRAQQTAHRRVGRRGGQPRRRAEPAVPRTDGDASLRPRHSHSPPDWMEGGPLSGGLWQIAPGSLSTTACAMKSPPTGKTFVPPKHSAAGSNTAEPRKPHPPARSRFAISTRSCAASLPSRSSPRPCWALRPSSKPWTPT
jgi:hypothetical protein